MVAMGFLGSYGWLLGGSYGPLCGFYGVMGGCYGVSRVLCMVSRGFLGIYG